MDDLLDRIRQRSGGSLDELQSALHSTFPRGVHVDAFTLSPDATVATLCSPSLLAQDVVFRKEHFVKSVLALIQTLSASGNAEAIQVVLRRVSWISKTFGQLVTLLCWEDLAEELTDRALPQLSVLLEHISPSSTPVLKAINNACAILKAQLSVIEQLQSFRSLQDDESFPTAKNSEFGELFNRAFADLQETSVLPAILNFARVDYITRETIQSLPSITCSISAAEVPVKKTVRFQSDDEEATEVRERSSSSCGAVDDASRSRDLAVYTGYSILGLIMTAIYRDAANRKMSVSSKRSSRHSIHRENSDVPEDAIGAEVTDAEKLLRDLTPLEFRVEILEDVFSLLFVRSNDMAEGHLVDDGIMMMMMNDGTDTDTNSVKSWSSAAKQIRDGFSCCSDRLVQKLLQMLKDVVISSLAVRDDDGLAEEKSVTFVTSVGKGEIPARLKVLQQRLTDASWRLGVVTFPKDVPMSLNSAYAEDLARPSFLTRKLDAKKSSRRRRRKRRASTILKKHMDTSIIEKMLASPGSLLRVCLHRGTFNLADQVIKIFALEDANWLQEITFGEAFQESVKQSRQKGDQRTKRLGSFEILSDQPLSPYHELTDEHVAVLVAVDLAVLRMQKDGTSPLKSLTDAMEKLNSARFPSTKSMNLPEMRAFEDFIKINLELAVTLNQKPPFVRAVPFNPVSAQSLAALLEEVAVRMRRLQSVVNEPGRPGNAGLGVAKQLLKIFRTNVPATTGLLDVIAEVQSNPQASRLNYFLAMLTFLKSYAGSLKMESEMGNFDLIYQSCYGHLRQMFNSKRPTNEIDAFIKNLSLDVAQILLHTTVHHAPSVNHANFTSVHSAGNIVLNDSAGPPTSHPRTSLTTPTQIIATALVRLLKQFTQLKDNIYSPTRITWEELSSSLNSLSALRERDVFEGVKTENERSAVLINLYNLLFIHSYVHTRSQSVKNDHDVGQRVHFWRYRYEIGPFRQVALQDLYDELSPFRHTNEPGRFNVTRRKENGFLMANSEHVIDVRVLHGALLEAQGYAAVADYLARTTWYDRKKKIVHLPTWLFRVYPSDRLMVLVKKGWRGASEVDFEEAILEPSGRVIRDAGLRRETSLDDKLQKILGPKRPTSAETEDHFRTLQTDILPQQLTDLPLEDLLPYLASPCSHLYDLLSPTGVTHSLLPAVESSRSLLKLLFNSHEGPVSTDTLCEIISATISRGGDPLAVLAAPLVRFAVARSEPAKVVRDLTLSLCVEKKLVASPWLVALRIRDRDLRMRAVGMVWRKWPLNACVEFADLVVGEDQRVLVQTMHIRVKNLKNLIQVLQSDATAWTEVFQQWNLDTVLNQMSVQDVEKRLESQFRAFSATMLRMDQIEPLNAWLRQSEMPSLSVYQDDLQLRGLVHMLDSRPPMILSAYQLLIPMLETSSFHRIIELLESVTTPEGRIPVIRIALMTARLNDIDTAKLKEKEVENLIIRTLPDLLRKSLAHLQGHSMLILEQLIVWSKLSYFNEIVKIPGLFDILSRRIFEDMLVEYAKKAVEVLLPSDVSEGSGGGGKRGPRGSVVDAAIVKKFYMPVAAPSRKEWAIDSAVGNCMVCGEKFGIVSSLFESVGLAAFNRKHHCRRCGRVVCVNCSAQTIQVDIYGDNPVRACDDCFEQTIAMGSSSSSSNLRKPSGITFSAPRIKSPIAAYNQSPARSTSLRFLRDRIVSPTGSSNSEHQWLFTTDEPTNQRLRSDFSFAEAPDAALCIGLLKLHSSHLVAGRELLKIGNELSEWIGSHNDCGLEHVTLVSIMRTLFFNAKLLLHEDKDNVDWINVCDTYLNQLQLVELLLDAGAAEIPSVQQLAELDTIRRVRDQLVQQERYALAVDLSTKAGLDPAHVWLSWGRCLLRVGKFAEAQEKLSKCLKIPVDKGQASPPSATALDDIMDVILDARMPRRRGTLGADSVVNIVTQGDVLKADVVDAAVAEHESFRKMTECLHYQELYGTHSTLLKFFVKRGLAQKALEYCLRENVNVETFMDTMVIPSLRSGQLSVFEDELLMSDPTLNKWADYLIGICKQLTKRNMNHVLLSFQLFIKDYARAATTCIMFFQTGPPSNSYQEYFDRLHHLEEAQKHLAAYLAQHTALSAESINRIRLSMSPEEVRKYIKTIKLQITITQLLAAKPQNEERRVSVSACLPTLFGNAQAKTDLIAMLLELHNTPKVDDSIAAVMDNHGLAAEEVLTKVAPLVSREGLKGILGVMLTMKKQKGLTDFAYDALVIRMIIQCGHASVALASKEWDTFIKQMSSDEKKVDAFIRARKLRSAYLLAVQMQRVDLVALVGTEAQTAGDSAVQNLCSRWLETKSRK
ncbi:Zinc finger FYVE domain-containing protein 26 [Hypsibius exemplaris]|uniref:Zinc finger FYVE domain-containing protein 26 n=1 Tax=Hypsibius exemplaris TaxID=2072580 RepID=A0A9X6NM47_HYPEX|nr:Zinc finger FYVE domain-containing protein 26 [Hypsibius exemplaris]